MSPTSEELLACMRNLADATNFTEASQALMSRCIKRLQAAIDASVFAGHAQVRRGTLHLRGDDDYRHLSVTEPVKPGTHPSTQGQPVASEDDPDLLPSTSLWEHVKATRAAVALDVVIGQLSTLGNPGKRRDRSAERLVSEGSLLQLRSRKTTHVLALPLEFPRGNLHGMVSLEVDCRRATGRDFAWQPVADYVSELLLYAAPMLTAYPTAARQVLLAHDDFPVAGAKMKEKLDLLRLFARQTETLLLNGATGTGKSQMATWVHQHSQHRDGPMRVLDLLGVPEALQLGRLFGWKKGAFTGAQSDSPGEVDLAADGSLFIDEIDKLSSEAQSSMLRLLETREYQRLGDTAVRKAANVRFVVGSSTDLLQAVENGDFRPDLYYRINVLPVSLPPLASRRDEIPDWVRYMLQRRHAELDRVSSCSIDPEALTYFSRCDWPGNLRQLDNVVRRAYVLGDRTSSNSEGVNITVEHARAAVSLDMSASEGGPVERLDECARSLLDFQRGGGADSSRLDVKRANVMYAALWAAALREFGHDHAAVAACLGREKSLASRNYYKELRREMSRLQSFYSWAGVAFPQDLSEYVTTKVE